jgi:hypothetical protein
MSSHTQAVRAAIKAGYVLVERPDNEESKLYGRYYWQPPDKLDNLPTGDKVVTDQKIIEQHKKF